MKQEGMTISKLKPLTDLEFKTLVDNLYKGQKEIDNHSLFDKLMCLVIICLIVIPVLAGFISHMCRLYKTL